MSKQRRRDTENTRRKIQQFFAQLIAKLRDWLNRTGSPLRLSRRFVRTLLSQSRTNVPRSGRQRGFVLPVTVMVTTVVTLLVVVMVGRATQRATTAANQRVEDAFRNAATPIVDRARAKIEQLLNDPILGRGLPSDGALGTTLENRRYTFADETRLQTVASLDGDTQIDLGDGFSADQGTEEILNSVWRFPVDTDGNGRFDTFGIYSIQFRSPALARQAGRPVSVLESRTPPMDESANSNICAQAAAAGTGAAGGGWEAAGNRLKKSFFIFATTIPITSDITPGQLTNLVDAPTVSGDPAFNSDAFDVNQYEVIQGNSSISALELQQDRSRTPLNNNAVWFESDLELARPRAFRLNGRVFTNSNLMIGAANATNPIDIYQVSDPRSCYYEEDNAKVLVAGNVINGDALTPDLTSLQGASFHLFKGAGINPLATAGGVIPFTGTDQTVTNPGAEAGFNDGAYNQRLNMLVQAAFAPSRWNYAAGAPVTPLGSNSDPQELIDAVAALQTEDPSLSIPDAYQIEYDRYFRNRTRKVPFAEVPFGDGTLNTASVFYSSNCAGNECTVANILSAFPNSATFLSPPLDWVLPPATAGSYSPYDPTIAYGLPADGNGLTINGTGALVNLPATEPTVQNGAGTEEFLGDRIVAGNNLPGLWYRLDGGGNPEFVGGTGTSGARNFVGATVGSIEWDEFGGIPEKRERYRTTQISTLVDLGDPGRSGFWERNAADDPSAGPGEATDTNPQSFPVTGGLRVVTSAGVYDPNPADTFLPQAPNVLNSPVTPNINESAFTVVWPDTMPMTGAVRWDGSAWRPYLLFDPGAPDRILTEDTNPNGVLDPGEDINGNGRLDRNGRWAAATDGGALLGANNAVNDPATGDQRNGHFQMRAIAVYHYKNSAYDPAIPGTYQAPIACVSAYYDNSTPETAQNQTGLPTYDGTNPGPGSSAQGRSNNGISYGPPTTTAAALGAVTAPDADGLFSPTTAAAPGGGSILNQLYFQANLVFPNGRLVNEPLRQALANAANGVNLSLANQSAIDSTICSLQILSGAIAPTNAAVPHGTFKEAAFLDGREIKAINRRESLAELDSVNYDLEIEQRQPLEIRVTDIDMNLLRGQTVAGGNNSGVATEYLLPYSGIVYATRDDALRDLSDTNTIQATREALSPTDFLLDPTRRPNGIRLVDGQRLWRGTGTGQPAVTTATEGEKGLIMVSNLPLYVKGDFNLHTQEEFNTALAADWGNFYTRNNGTPPDYGLNPDFACRPGSNVNCTNGDEWRPATIISDAVSIVSAASNDGFRSDGDFDLRNNQDTSVYNDQSDPYSPGSSFDREILSPAAKARLKNGFFNNNFVTSANWVDVADEYPGNNRSTFNANGVTPIQRRENVHEYGMEICRKLPVSECEPQDWVKDYAGTTGMREAGTNVAAPRWIDEQDQRFARRFSFLRYDDIYHDGNESLLFVARCDSDGDLSGQNHLYQGEGGNTEDWQMFPIALGVVNGAGAGGRTYPNVFGISREAPFHQDGNYRNAYGTVPCPPRERPYFEFRGGDSRADTEGTDYGSDGLYRTIQFKIRLRGQTTPGTTYYVQPFTCAFEDALALFSPCPSGYGVGNRPGGASPGESIPPYDTQLGNPKPGTVPYTNLVDNEPAAAPLTALAGDPVNVHELEGPQDFIALPEITPVPSFPVDPPNGQYLAWGPNAATYASNPAYQKSNYNNTISINVQIYKDRLCEYDEYFWMVMKDGSSDNPSSVPVIRTGGAGRRRGKILSRGRQANPDSPLTTGNSNRYADVSTQPPFDNVGSLCQTTNPTPTPTPTPTPAPTPTPDIGVGAVEYPTVAQAGFNGMPIAMVAPPLNTQLSSRIAAAYPWQFDANEEFDPNPTNGSNDNDTESWQEQAAPNSLNLVIHRAPNFPIVPPTGLFAGNQGDGRGNTVMIYDLDRDSENEPNPQPRNLWYTTTTQSTDMWLGRSWMARYNPANHPFIFEAFTTGATNRNDRPSSPDRYVLPRAECMVISGNDVLKSACPDIDTAFGYGTTPTIPANQVNLNLPVTENAGAGGGTNIVRDSQSASAYLFCGYDGEDRHYMAEKEEMRSGNCPDGTRTVINDVYTKLSNLSNTGVWSVAPTRTFFVGGDEERRLVGEWTANADRQVNVLTLPNTFTNENPLTTTPAQQDAARITQGRLFRDARITLRAGDQKDPIFVIKLPEPQANPAGNLNISNVIFDGVQMQLDGVSPNNIYWLMPRQTAGSISGTDPQYRLQFRGLRNGTVMAGNFLTPIESGSTPANATELLINDNAGSCLSYPIALGGNNPLTSNRDRFEALGLNLPAPADSSLPDDDLPPGMEVRCTSFRGVRFLGFSTYDQPPAGIPDLMFNAWITAVTSTDEPIMMPVTQLHSPEDNPTTNNGLGSRMPQEFDQYINSTGGRWTEQASDTIVNAYFVSGNTPSRAGVTYQTSDLDPTNPVNAVDGNSTGGIDTGAGIDLGNPQPVTTTGETGGGLHNFVRFIENWADTNIQINGGFIQSFRSRFATAPFSATAPYPATDALGLFTRNGMQTLFTDPNHVNGPLSNFWRFYQSRTTQRIPFYNPPNRLWGYDVGLLTQSPDLFAQRFSTAVPDPNEFFREVDRDDPFVQSLLCAYQPGTLDVDTVTGQGPDAEAQDYVEPAIAGQFRPATCPVGTPPNYVIN